MTTRVQDQLLEVQDRIQRASMGRNNVTLIAVSKTKPSDLIKELFDAGHLKFGENRVQEARNKAAILPDAIDWHLIGPLQNNKAKYCPSIFSTIHTIHRVDTALLLNQKCAVKNKIINVLVQMNLTSEATKSGVQSLDQLRILTDELITLDHLRLTGMMTMGDPSGSDFENQKVFEKLRQINENEADRLGLKEQMKELSMGMTNDFELALKEGATMIRVGSAIFGNR